MMEMIFSLSEMLKMDDEFATSVIAALSTFNYYHDSPCRTFLMQALKSSCTVCHTSLIGKRNKKDFHQSVTISGSTTLQYESTSSDSSV